MSTQKSILIISYNYDPLVNPRSLRWTAISEELARQGHNVHIVASKVHGSPSFETKNGVNIHRVGWRKQVPPKSARTKQSAAATPSRLVVIIKEILRALVKKVMWPDSNFLWVNKAVKKSLEIIAKNNIENVISVSHPFSGHVVGRKVHEKNKAINWVADMGDPFAFLDLININNKLLFAGLNYSYEKKVVKKSNWQTVTTSLTRQEYLDHQFECRDSMLVVPHLLRSYSQNFAQRDDSKVFRWVFLGTLYKKIRNPTFLLSLFDRVRILDKERTHELHFYGETKMCREEIDKFRAVLGDRLVIHGLVPPEAAAKACSKASLLVNIGNKTSYQLPSKLVEYMALGKPILNLKSIDKDSSEDFLKDYPLAITLSETKPIGEQMNRLLQGIHSEEQLSDEQINELIKPFLIGSVSESYTKLLV